MKLPEMEKVNYLPHTPPLHMITANMLVNSSNRGTAFERENHRVGFSFLLTVAEHILGKSKTRRPER
jgi:hypothetical protein